MRGRTIFFLSILFLLVIVTFVGAYKTVIKKSVLDETCNTIQQNTVRLVVGLDSILNYASDSVQLIADFITHELEQYNTFYDDSIIKSFIESTPFNNINYIHEGKDNFTPTKKENSNSPDFFLNFENKSLNTISFDFYKQIKVNNEPKGTVVASIDANVFKPFLQFELHGIKTTGIICDSNMTVITSTSEKYIPKTNLADYGRAPLIKEIQNKAQNKDTKAFKFTEKGAQGIICISQLYANDFYIIQAIFPNELSQEISGLSIKIFALTGIILLLFLSYFAYLVFKDRAVRIEKEKSHLNLINALSTVYQNVYVVNLETGQFYIYKMSNVINAKYHRDFSQGDWHRNFKLYAQNEVYKEDRKLFDTISTTEKLRAIFAEKEEYSFFYRVLRDGQLHDFQCEMLKPKGSEIECVAAFKNVDDLMWNTQTRQLSILSSMAQIFLTVYFIDLTSNSFMEMNSIREIQSYLRKDLNATEQMRIIMENIIMPSSMEWALEFTDLTTLQERMEGKQYISAELNGKNKGWFRANFIKVDSNDDGSLKSVIFATQLIEKEKRREQKLLKKANTDELTSCLNRHAFEEDTKKYEIENFEKDFVYVSMDVNGLKTTNDTLGHIAGDELLKGAASCINKTFSKYGKIYRTGGDEFQAIIFANNELLLKLQKLLEKNLSNWQGKLVKEVSLSAGYAKGSEFGQHSIMEVARIADQRMYKQKSFYYTSKGLDRRGQQVALTVLCKSYEKILKMNLIEDSFSVIYSRHQNNDEDFGGKASDWFETFLKSGTIHRSDVKNLEKALNISNLQKYFSSTEDNESSSNTNDSFVINFRIFKNGVPYMANIEIIPMQNNSSDEQIVFLYFRTM